MKINALVLACLALNVVAPAIAAVETGSVPAKTHMIDVGAGRVAWFDLTTTKMPQSQEFYGKLFGWKFDPVPGTDQAAQIVSHGTAIGTIRVAEGNISQSNGVVYIQVDDIQDSSNLAKALGATMSPGFPFNLPSGTGAISVVTDPSGHPVGMFSRKPMSTKN
jgi:predicted enzyme related to lactoylglutathione lyase